jgi:hypothetical protein
MFRVFTSASHDLSPCLSHSTLDTRRRKRRRKLPTHPTGLASGLTSTVPHSARTGQRPSDSQNKYSVKTHRHQIRISPMLTSCLVNASALARPISVLSQQQLYLLDGTVELSSMKL